MAINSPNYHRDNFRLTQALGAKLNAGDATFAPEGFESLYLLVKQFPHPTIAGGQEIDVPTAGGGSMWEQQPTITKFQGQITFLETEAGSCKQFARDVLGAGGYFNARIYEGTPDRHIRSYLVEKCFFTIDPSDRDWENRAQVLMLNGTLFFHYFGEERPGNI